MKQQSNNQENGQGIVEYGLIIGLIAVIIVAIFVALGPQIKAIFQGKTSDVDQTIEGTQTTNTGTITTE
jgi:pilus assembly protein Flp/PilA